MFWATNQLSLKMVFIQIYSIVLLVILGLMTILWFVSLVLKNSSIVDIFWATGFVVAYWVYFILTPEGFLLRKCLIGILGHGLGITPIVAYPVA